MAGDGRDARGSHLARRFAPAERLPGVLVAVLAAAACYETAVALGLLDVGPLPGQGPPGEDAVLLPALAALLAGAGLVIVSEGPLAWLLAPAAGALVVARFFSFDPYYAPTLRRMSDGGAVSPGWVGFLAAAALVAGVALRVGLRRSGAFLSAAVLVLSFATVVFEGAGH